jgi:hypothetical protein
MRRLIILCSAALFFATLSTAQTISYDLANVPEAVKKNASVIKQYENILFEVTDIDRASLSVHKILTVVNEEGKRALSFAEHSSKFVALEDAEVKVFDAKGKQINKFRKKDFTTMAMGDGLIDDGKTTFLTVSVPGYPITIEYKYEMRFKGTLTYPGYEILVPGEGVENSSFTAKVPLNLDLRYKEKNIALSPQISDDGKYKFYKWSVTNLAPVEYEEGAVSYRHRYPSIFLAPNRFKMDDYDGDMTSWKKFGLWYAELKKGTDVLPEERKVFFRNMVKNEKDDREKMKIIYNYLQKNFRYVSIQLGIGGYKPFSANFTDQKKYGDCKGLSNYTQAALDAIGVKSYIALINRQSNDEPVDPAFTCNQFNHVILCVPHKKDTIWLECTSKTLLFGRLDISTENRNALLITEDGGVLVPTPRSKSSENTFTALTSIQLNENGSGISTSSISTSGEYKEQMQYVIDEKKDDQKNIIVNYFGFKQPDEFMISKKGEEENLTAILEMELEKIPEFVTGNKMFISPRIYKLWSVRMPRADNRKQDYYFPFPIEKTDTTIFKLPDGYKSEALPLPKDLKCAYASYTAKYWYDDRQKTIYSTSKLVISQYKIPASKYAEVKKFFDEVLMDDSQRIIIRKE